MKLDVLKEYIKKTVQEEVRGMLKEELKYQLTELILGSDTSIIKSKTDKKLMSTVEDSGESISSETTNFVTENKKKQVKYTNNPILNQVLNDTVGGVPSEGQMVGLMDGGFGNNVSGREQINEIKVPDNAPEPVKTVYSAMTRDYRSLMKAVDKKKKNK